MKRILTGLMICAFALLGTAPAQALLMSNTDAWEYTNINATSFSGIYYRSLATNMFGAAGGSTDIGATLFNDWQPVNTWHWISWQLNAPVTLGSFNLVAAHDGGTRNINYRGFTGFRLDYYDTATSVWQTLFSLPDTDPDNDNLYGGGTNYTGQNYLELYQTVTPTTASLWRAWFQQPSSRPDGNASGPRILELDGYVYTPGNNTVPEPATLALLGMGLGGMALRRRRS